MEEQISETWAVWLKNKSGYSESRARQLRFLSNIIGEYPLFFRVGLSFNILYNKRTEIKKMLQILDYQQYWKQDPGVPPSTNLQQSQ